MIKDKVVIITGAGMTAMYEQYGISPDRVANVVAFAIDLPEDTTVNEFTIGPAISPGENGDCSPLRCQQRG